MIFRNVIGGSIIRGLLLVALLTFVLNDAQPQALNA